MGFGIEEEYFLLDLVSGQIVVQPSPKLIGLCRQVLGRYFSQEMFKAQIEVSSPIFNTVAQAREFLGGSRAQLAAVLAEEGVGLISAGSHPMGGWHSQQPSETLHYRQLFDDYQQVARRSLMNGLHVHVCVPDSYDRIRLINQLLPWLPLLLLLSTSSPFWEKQPSGYMSYRRVACGEWPRMGLPEPLADWQDYERYLALMRRTGSLREDNDCWWAIRPSRRFPTVELRIADACPRLEDALCIAGLFHSMVEYCLAQPCSAGNMTREQQWIAQENYWRAMRYGRHGQYIGAYGEEQYSAQQWLAHARDTFELAPRSNVCSFDHAQAIIATGTSSDRQLACYARSMQSGNSRAVALLAVVNELREETAATTSPVQV